MAYEFEVAEETVKMSLSGIEMAASIAGDAAERLLRILYLILTSDGQKELPIRNRLRTILNEGRELKIYSIRDGDLPAFTKGAQSYGIECYFVKDKDLNDGITDIIADSFDAKKINRIFERNNIPVPERSFSGPEQGETKETDPTMPSGRPETEQEAPAPPERAAEPETAPAAPATGGVRQEENQQAKRKENDAQQPKPEKPREQAPERPQDAAGQRTNVLPKSIRTKRIPGMNGPTQEKLDDVIERNAEELRNSRRYRLPQRKSGPDLD